MKVVVVWVQGGIDEKTREEETSESRGVCVRRVEYKTDRHITNNNNNKRMKVAVV